MTMQKGLIVLLVVLAFMPASLSEDHIVQKISANHASIGNVSINGRNMAVIHNATGAYAEQSIDQLGISTAGSVTQNASNEIAITSATSDGIIVNQSIHQEAQSDRRVDQAASNIITDNINCRNATISQCIEQIATSFNLYAYNTIDGFLVNNVDSTIHDIVQSAES